MPEHTPHSSQPPARLDSYYSPFRYPGGKRPLLPQTTAWLEDHGRARHLVEGFAGGASVGVTALCEDRIDRLTLIEFDAEVAHTWETIFSPQADELAARLLALPALDDAFAVLDGPPSTDPVGRALRLLLLNRVRRNGILADGAGEIGRDGKTSRDRHRYIPSAMAARILNLAARRDAVEVRHGDALKLLPEYADAPDTVFYLDPPYSLPGGPAKRLYRCWRLNHTRLFSLIGRLRGDVLVSHQDHPTVRRLAQANGLQLAQIDISTTHGRVPELLMARQLHWLKQTKTPARALPPLPLGRLTRVNLALLPVFVAVAEQLHFTRAALALGLTKPTVSRRIQELEAQVGAPLLERTTQSVALTSAGRALYGQARSALLTLDEAFNAPELAVDAGECPGVA